MIPELVDIGLTDAQAVEAMQRAFRCMTRDETEAQIGAEAAARQNADDALTAAIAQLNTALLNYAKRQELAAEITERTAGFDAHEAAFRAVFAAGAKNLLNVQDAENYRAGQGSFPITISGVMFTENSGLLITSGTASAAMTLRVPITLGPGAYTVSGSPPGGSDTSYRVDVRYAGTDNYPSADRDYGSGFSFSLTETTALDWCIMVQSGTDMSGLIFRPMIRRAEIADDTFVPYAPTNLELYGLVSDLDDTKATVGDIYGLPQKTIAPADGTTDTLASHIQPGTYVIPTAAAAGRITDAPISDRGYRMEVKQYRSGTYYRQTIMPWSEPNAVYTRSRQGGTNWTAWYKFEGTQAAVSAQSSAPAPVQSGLTGTAELTDTQEVTDDA